MKDYRVTILPGGSHADPLGSTAQLWLAWRVPGAGPVRVLRMTPSGWIWETMIEGETAPQPTLEFPDEAIEALAEAIETLKGMPSHARTESAVLREWLAAERARVDEFIAELRKPIVWDLATRPGPTIK